MYRAMQTTHTSRACGMCGAAKSPTQPSTHLKNTQGTLWCAHYWVRVTNGMRGSELSPLLLMLRKTWEGSHCNTPNASCLEGCFFPPAFPAWPFSTSCGTNVRIILTRKSLNHALKSVCTWENPNLWYMHQYGSSLIARNLWINAIPARRACPGTCPTLGCRCDTLPAIKI